MRQRGFAALGAAVRCVRSCSTAESTAPAPARLVSVYEHAHLSGIYTVAMEAPPANVLTAAMLRQLTAAITLLGEAAVGPEDSAGSLPKKKPKRKVKKGAEATERDAEEEPRGAEKTAAATIRERNRPRGIVLTSSVPGCFSGGLDLDVLASEPLIEPEEFAAYWHTFQDAWLALHDVALPVVAAINGNAPAAGCILAGACDARVMVETVPPIDDPSPKRGPRPATIGITAARAGFAAPPWVAADLNRLVGWRLAEEMLVTGRLLTAREAADAGLVDHVVTALHADAPVGDADPAQPDAASLPRRRPDGLLDSAAMWSTAEARTGCTSLTGAALDAVLDYAEVPPYAYWLTKSTFRELATSQLPASSRELRARDAMRFYNSISGGDTRARLLAYRGSLRRAAPTPQKE